MQWSNCSQDLHFVNVMHHYSWQYCFSLLLWKIELIVGDLVSAWVHYWLLHGIRASYMQSSSLFFESFCQEMFSDASWCNLAGFNVPLLDLGGWFNFYMSFFIARGIFFISSTSFAYRIKKCFLGFFHCIREPSGYLLVFACNK